jgi:hypothetical protein
MSVAVKLSLLLFLCSLARLSYTQEHEDESVQQDYQASVTYDYIIIGAGILCIDILTNLCFILTLIVQVPLGLYLLIIFQLISVSCGCLISHYTCYFSWNSS